MEALALRPRKRVKTAAAHLQTNGPSPQKPLHYIGCMRRFPANNQYCVQEHNNRIHYSTNILLWL
ncbi:protein of unknown function [Hyphomicrobium sp. 1Nfss2.1]